MSRRNARPAPLPPLSGAACLAALALCAGPEARAAAMTTAYYGDADWFGYGVPVTTIDPTVAHGAGGNAGGTDVRLIGETCVDRPCVAPAFRPTGGFDPFVTLGVVTSAVLTLRAGAFDSGPNPFDGPNLLLLDGLAVPSSFLSGFSTQNTDNVETRSISLGAEFFPLIADGRVGLMGTWISNDTNSGSFQIDFLSLKVTSVEPPPPPPTNEVPAPPAAALLLGALGLLSLARRR